MFHVAIDLGARESQICVREKDGTILEERRVDTLRLGQILMKLGPSRVIVETSTGAFSVADEALELGHEVRVIPATLVRALGVGDHGIKNDRRDAQHMSHASTCIDLPSVHIPSKINRERKSFCGMREALIKARTQLINTVRGWLRGGRQRVRSGAAETLPMRVRQHYDRLEQELPSYVLRQLQTIDLLSEQIKEADKDLELQTKEDEICQRLMSTPGVGPVTALRFVATVDSIARFNNAHVLESYIGLTPGENSSGDKQRRTGITRAGAAALRWTLVQAAWSLRRCRPNDPMVLWNREIERRRGKQIAIVALARKLAGVLFALWRDGTHYNPLKAAEARIDDHQ